MTFPSMWPATLLALAAYRTWRLLGIDVILNRPRDWLVGANTTSYKETLDDFLACPWCLGTWVAGAWWLLWALFPTFALFAAAPLAVATVVGLIRTRLDA